MSLRDVPFILLPVGLGPSLEFRGFCTNDASSMKDDSGAGEADGVVRESPDGEELEGLTASILL